MHTLLHVCPQYLRLYIMTRYLDTYVMGTYNTASSPLKTAKQKSLDEFDQKTLDRMVQSPVRGLPASMKSISPRIPTAIKPGDNVLIQPNIDTTRAAIFTARFYISFSFLSLNFESSITESQANKVHRKPLSDCQCVLTLPFRQTRFSVDQDSPFLQATCQCPDRFVSHPMFGPVLVLRDDFGYRHPQ